EVPGADHRHAASSTLEIPEGLLRVCVLAWRRRHPGLSGATFTGDPLGDASFTEPKREALAKRYKRGRPEWETTAPDHADEHPDLAWERERRRRGLR
ncbi:MAG: hypothetical protein ACXWZZ_07395, partial [Solirubrobacteraceae bacterium]